MQENKIIPVILSGGTGQRLWPLSNTLYPKQLQPLISDKSLLQETVIRTSGTRFEPPIIVCNEDHRFIVAEHLREIDTIPSSIVLEPIGRNTAPAVAVAAILSEEICEDAILLILPSDHIIKKPKVFNKVLNIGWDAAINSNLVTFGTTVTRPESGYGYIQPGNALANISGCYHVSNFIEKPDKETAVKLYNSGNYYWNSGIFMFSANTYLNELSKFQPNIVRLSKLAVEKKLSELDFIRLEEQTFKQISPTSIDRAVMEHSENVTVVPANMEWSDVGSWDALWAISSQDENGNVITGEVVTDRVRNSYIRSERKWIAALGIQDTIVISTEDAVLVASKDQAQQVKNLVQKLENTTFNQQVSRSKIYRPWGWFQSLEVGEGFQVKLINLKPGAKISLQRHQHRAEHWVVVAGTATVTRGNEVIELEANQSTFISAGETHRLENNADIPLEVIEVQSGTYLGEDDIERLDDHYGRT